MTAKKSDLSKTECAQCSTAFPSRRKLFQHLRESGHGRDFFPTLLLQEVAARRPDGALGALESTTDVDAASDSGATALMLAVRQLEHAPSADRPRWLRLVEGLVQAGAACDAMTRVAGLWGDTAAGQTPFRVAIRGGDFAAALAAAGLPKEVARHTAPFMQAGDVELVVRRVPLACGHTMTEAEMPAAERDRVALRCGAAGCGALLSVQDAQAVLRCHRLLAAAAQGQWGLLGLWLARSNGDPKKTISAAGSSVVDKIMGHLRRGTPMAGDARLAALLTRLLDAGTPFRHRYSTGFLAAAQLSNHEATGVLVARTAEVGPAGDQNKTKNKNKAKKNKTQRRAEKAWGERSCTVHSRGGCLVQGRAHTLACGHKFCVEALRAVAETEAARGGVPRCVACPAAIGGRDLAVLSEG